MRKDLKAGKTCELRASNGRTLKIQLKKKSKQRPFDLKAARKMKGEANLAVNQVKPILTILRDLGIPVEPNLTKQLIESKADVAEFYDTTEYVDGDKKCTVVYNNNYLAYLQKVCLKS